MKVQEIIFVVEESPVSGHNARALQSIFAQGDTFQELKDNIKDTLECAFVRKDDIPGIVKLHTQSHHPGPSAD